MNQKMPVKAMYLICIYKAIYRGPFLPYENNLILGLPCGKFEWLWMEIDIMMMVP